MSAVNSANGEPAPRSTAGPISDIADVRAQPVPSVDNSRPFVDAAGSAPGDRAFRPDIEGLRAVAVLLVVFFHAGAFHLVGGYVGVDVFFVISGFVITGLLLRERASTGKTKILTFYGRRVRRIIPTATLVIVAALIGQRVLVSTAAAQQSATGARWATVFLANKHPSFLLGTYWSLAVEEQFYLVYPALVLLVAAVGRQWSLKAKLGVILPIIIVGSYSWSVLGPPGSAYDSLFSRAWELAVGALLAIGTDALRRMPETVATVMTWSGLVGLAIIGFTLNFSSSYPGSAGAYPVTATALIIAGGTAAPRAGAEAMLKLSPFRWLGRRSYSLYLWHWPIILIAAQHWHSTNTVRNQILVGVAVVLSAVTYFAIENPIRHSAFLKQNPLASIALGLVLILACLGLINLVA